MAKVGATTTVTENLNDIVAYQESLIIDTYLFAVDATDGAIKKGTAVAIVTATGKAKVYDNSHSDGTETAVGIIAESVDVTTQEAVCAVIIEGYLHKDRLYHYAAGTETASLDAAAVTDLRGREYQNNLIKIG